MKFAYALALASTASAGWNDGPWNVTMNGTRFEGNHQFDNATGSVNGSYAIMTRNGNRTHFAINFTASNETNSYANGRAEAIGSVMDYLWYGLDAWGKENRNSTNPQCSDSNACSKIGQNACCASINMKNMWEGQSHYVFRCMNTGMLQSHLSFKLRDTLDVNVRCKDGKWNNAMKLTAGVAATAAALASMY